MKASAAVEAQPAGGQISAVAFPPTETTNIIDNGNSIDSVFSTTVALNADGPAPGVPPAGSTVENTVSSKGRSSANQNANTGPVAGKEATATAQTDKIGSVTTPPAITSPPPSFGNSVPTAEPENSAALPNATPVAGSIAATTPIQSTQQIPDFSNPLGTQSAQTTATATTTGQPEQKQSGTSKQAFQTSNPQSTETSPNGRIIGSSFGPSATTGIPEPARQDTSKQAFQSSNPQVTKASSTGRIIGSAFGPPATTGIREPARKGNGADASGDGSVHNNADNGGAAAVENSDPRQGSVNTNSDNAGAAVSTVNSNVNNEASARIAAAGSGASNQVNVAQVGSAVAVQASQDPAADTSNLAEGNVLGPASTVSDPSRPSISGLGQVFSGTQSPASARPTAQVNNGSGIVPSATAGISTATSLATSAIASLPPTKTVGRGGTPSVSLTRESAKGLNVVANAFSDPSTRPRAIGILVAVVVGFNIIVALLVFLFLFLRRRKRQKQENEDGLSPTGDGEKGQLDISGPVNQPTQEGIANYDPSAELMADSAGLDYGPSQPSQLDNALVDRASRLSTSRKSFLDIYGGVNTPYPQDVVDGNGRPLTQQFLMPEVEKFQELQLKGLGPMSPFNPKLAGVNAKTTPSSHQRNISTASRLSSLPENVNPNQPAPYTHQELPISPVDPALSAGRLNPIAPEIRGQAGGKEFLAEHNVAPTAPPAVAKVGNKRAPKSRPRDPKHTDSWMTVNTVATGKAAPRPPTAVGGGITRNPSRTDYASVYMRNPFIDPLEAAGDAPTVPAMPAIPRHLQNKQQSRQQQTESVTLMFSSDAAKPPPQYNRGLNRPVSRQARPLSGPGDTEVMYGGVLDDYPPQPPSSQVGVSSSNARSHGHSEAYSGGAGGVLRKSNPFDLEVNDGRRGNGGGDFRDDGTVRSVQTWLSSVAEAERSRMERENVI